MPLGIIRFIPRDPTEVQWVLRVIGVKVDALAEQASNELEVGLVCCSSVLASICRRATCLEGLLRPVLQPARNLRVVAGPRGPGFRVHWAVTHTDEVGVALPITENVSELREIGAWQ